MSVLQLKKANCKNCYKCIRTCPLKAIEVVEHQARIIESECVQCGRCILACPQNAKEVRCDIPPVRQLVESGKEVIASVAPSFIADFPVEGFEQMRNALRRLGFADAYETAEGAFVVKTRYEDLVRQQWNSVIISSCCPTVTALIEKHYPKALPYLAPVVSPMEASGALIRARHPNAVIVFLGPCISKKEECAQRRGDVSFALTFEELSQWMGEIQVGFDAAEGGGAPRLSRFFPISGGILQTMEHDDNYHYITIDGMENCMKALAEIGDNKLSHCFIEMSACPGSCSGGPMGGRHRPSPVLSSVRVEQYAASSARDDFDCAPAGGLERAYQNLHTVIMPPDEAAIASVLRQMGKKSPADELNCGTCGYQTCRDKAIAVLQGKADVTMCLPYMKERAESVSDTILDSTPNAVVTVSEGMEIQQINPAACRLLGVGKPDDVLGTPVSLLLDEYDFVTVVSEGEPISKKKVYLAEYNKYVEQSFVPDRSSGAVICIMQDVTDREQKRQELLQAKLSATEITSKIVEKQMRIVHEIASLLGETAAETKIALTELRNTISMEEDDET